MPVLITDIMSFVSEGICLISDHFVTCASKFHFLVIKVEQPVARLPPHRSLRAVFSHRALQERSLSHSGYSPDIPSLSSLSKYSDLRLRDFKVLHQFIESCPIIGFSLAPSIQPLVEDFLCSFIIVTQSFSIHGDCVVIIITLVFAL